MKAYLSVKAGEFEKAERDMIAVSVKQMIERERATIKLLDSLLELPKLKRFENSIRVYAEKMKEEMRQKLSEVISMLHTAGLSS